MSVLEKLKNPYLYLNLQTLSILPMNKANKESELLKNAHLDLPFTFWEKYLELKRKRQQETLTPIEQQELINLSDQLETANASRMPYLIELAQVRNIPLETLLQQIDHRSR